MHIAKAVAQANAAPDQVPICQAAKKPSSQVLQDLQSSQLGLSSSTAQARALQLGKNIISSHHASAWRVFVRQIANPFLILLFITAALSLFLGDLQNSSVIGAILLASIGMGFFNEYRAEKASQDLHDRVQHRVLTLRDGSMCELSVIELVPGDIVQVGLGTVVPADIRLVSATELTVDESVLTGESEAVSKGIEQVALIEGLSSLASCILMGTVVKTGTALGVVVATGHRSVFGKIAFDLSQAEPETEFQSGLRRFSVLLLRIAVILTVLILVINFFQNRPWIEAIMFSLAIAVGITPQLLPAVVSASLASGSRRLAKKQVLVKSLMSIEDLGNLDLLLTDKTGTLTTASLAFLEAKIIDPAATPQEIYQLGLLAIDEEYAQASKSTIGLNQLDAALWNETRFPKIAEGDYTKLATAPFDHNRRMVSVIVSKSDDQVFLISKGSPEDLLAKCAELPEFASKVLSEQYELGHRVLAVATKKLRTQGEPWTINSENESGLALSGFLVFADPVKLSAKDSLKKLSDLGIQVKIATGDSAQVAQTVCDQLGLATGDTLTGAQISELGDEQLSEAAAKVRIFARVSPDQKARLVRVLRSRGLAVGFLGDGVNDAPALHDADVGISVETATDVAKDAANVVLLDKDLGVLADGVQEGRRIFANTIKYVLMGTSSNFGNMFSAAAASSLLPFLPMLPGQILLNNLLYDSGQLSIPGDHVDPEQLRKPSHWDIGFIRRFMLTFGPLSSIFDFATFALLLLILHAGPAEFRAGWFIESLATQTLIVFSIRTRRVPFFRSRPSLGIAVCSGLVVSIGAFLPLSPFSRLLGFTPLPAVYFEVLAGMTLVYLVLVEVAKVIFYRAQASRVNRPLGRKSHQHASVHRRRLAFSTATPPRAAGLPRKRILRKTTR